GGALLQERPSIEIAATCLVFHRLRFSQKRSCDRKVRRWGGVWPAVFCYAALAATRLQPSGSLPFPRGRWRALGKCSNKRMPKKGEISMRVNDRQMLFPGRFLVSLTKGAVRSGFALLLAGLLTADRKSTRLNSSHVSISYAV